jgi:hypothetical protein
MTRRDGRIKAPKTGASKGSLLPRALLVAIRFQALSALVLVHLQTAFLFQISHGDLEAFTVLPARPPVKLNLRRRHSHSPLHSREDQLA